MMSVSLEVLQTERLSERQSSEKELSWHAIWLAWAVYAMFHIIMHNLLPSKNMSVGSASCHTCILFVGRYPLVTLV